MSPTIPANSYLIFHHIIFRQLLTVGKIIKVQHPLYGTIVKRITRVDKKGFYWLAGMNVSSISSVEMGAIDFTMIKGVLLYNIRPTYRAKHNNKA